jgi:hypothetical protein
MELIKKRSIEIIFGKTGTGKTVLAKELAQRFDRIIVIDSHSEYEEGIIFNSFDELTAFIKEITEEKILNVEYKFTFICRFTDDEEIELLFYLAFALGNLVIVLEEAELYISPMSKKGGFLKLVRHGRHRDISIIGIARRTVELHSDLRAMSDIIYSFKQTHPNDLKIMESIGLTGLENLGEHQHIFMQF